MQPLSSVCQSKMQTPVFKWDFIPALIPVIDFLFLHFLEGQARYNFSLTYYKYEKKRLKWKGLNCNEQNLNIKRAFFDKAERDLELQYKKICKILRTTIFRQNKFYLSLIPLIVLPIFIKISTFFIFLSFFYVSLHTFYISIAQYPRIKVLKEGINSFSAKIHSKNEQVQKQMDSILLFKQLPASNKFS